MRESEETDRQVVGRHFAPSTMKGKTFTAPISSVASEIRSLEMKANPKHKFVVPEGGDEQSPCDECGRLFDTNRHFQEQ